MELKTYSQSEQVDPAYKVLGSREENANGEIAELMNEFEALRRPQTKDKVCTDREFVEQFVGEAPVDRGTIIKNAQESGDSRATADRYLARLSEAGVIGCGGGPYWRREG